MTLLQSVTSFALVAGLLTLVPGIDTSLVLRGALVKGRAYAFATAMGIFVGALVWGVAAAVGASALLAASEIGYRMLTIAGAAYMVWLGGSLIWKSFRRGPTASDQSESSPSDHRESLGRAWATGFGSNLLNPKVGVFYLATIPQFIPEGASPAGVGLLLAAVHGVLSVAWFTAIIVATGFFAKWLRSERALRLVDRVTGVVLIGFGAKLVASAR